VGKEDGTVGDYSLQREADTHGHFGREGIKKTTTVIVDKWVRWGQ